MHLPPHGVRHHGVIITLNLPVQFNSYHGIGFKTRKSIDLGACGLTLLAHYVKGFHFGLVVLQELIELNALCFSR